MTRIVTVQLVQIAEVELMIEDGDDPIQIALDMNASGDGCVSFGQTTGHITDDVPYVEEE